MERVLVAREAVDQRLLGHRRHLDHAIRLAIGCLVAGLRARFAAEATLAAQEQREAVREQRSAGLVARRDF